MSTVLPSSAVVTLIARGNEVVPPTGNTRLLGWDQVTVLARPRDEEAVRRALLDPFESAEPAVAPDAVAAEAALLPPDSEAIARLRDHVVLLGHGRVGATLAGMLREQGMPFVVIEQDWLTVSRLHGSGTLALAGEGGRPEVLDRARIADARLLLVTTANPLDAAAAVEHAHRVNPRIEVVARVHFAQQREQLERHPRTRTVHGEEELAAAMARLAFGAPGGEGS